MEKYSRRDFLARSAAGAVALTSPALLGKSLFAAQNAKAESAKMAEHMVEDGETDVPSSCPKTNGKLKSFTEVAKEGINCPSCGEKLFQCRWFTNEA